MISIVSTNFRMSGGLLNHLDTYAFLRSLHPTYYYLDMGEAPIWDMLMQTKRNYDLKYPVKIDGPIEDEIIITDFRGLIVLNNEGYQLNCKKLVVMDCLELTYHLNEMHDAIDWFFWFDFSYADSIYKYLKFQCFEDIVFLMPPSNYNKFFFKYPELKAQVFFKKINVDVLGSMRSGIIEDCLTYKRRPEVSFHEQFGRRIFEHILMGSTVYCEGYADKEDGLCDYLAYYDIRFDGDMVATKAHELERRMRDDGKYLRSEALS